MVAGTPRKNQKFTCLYCNEALVHTNFYKSRNPYMWRHSYGRCLICKGCLVQIFEDLKHDYPEGEALMAMCSMIGWPFYVQALNKFREKRENITLLAYMRAINMRQYKKQPFWDSMLEDENRRASIEKPPIIQTIWNNNDKRNKKHVLESVGYDPFEGQSMSDADVKYCFNILADFCDIDGIQSDAHKMQSVIELTNLHLQVHKIDRWISQESLKANLDQKAISEFTKTKKNLIDTIAQISKDNGIGSQYNSANSKGKGTLTGKMKEMDDEKLIESKVNKFDIKTCEAMQQISDINTKSILTQLELDDSDYAKMLANSRQERSRLESENDQLREEVRNLKNKLGSLGHIC